MFFIGLTILSSFTNASFLSCMSMNNQEYKTRPKIVNVNSNNPIFPPFSIKTSKCSGNCNNINNPYAKICVPDVIKDLKVKLFYLMSRTNETRFTESHETSKCKCRLDAIVCNNKHRWNKDQCRCECKELIDKEVCNKGFIWNPSNCECECDKAFNFGDYLDYENCKCWKKSVSPLTEECTETIEEVKLAEITLFKNENSYKCSPFTVHIVLLLIFFTINIGGIATYYVYSQWYLKKDALHVEFNTHKETTIYWMQFHWIYKWKKANKLTLKIELNIFTTIKLI